jgi:hypothetical protein
MLYSKNTNRNALINDLVKNTTILLVIHILTKTRAGAKLFDEESVYGIIFFLVSLVMYHIVVVNFVPPL